MRRHQRIGEGNSSAGTGGKVLCALVCLIVLVAHRAGAEDPLAERAKRALMLLEQQHYAEAEAIFGGLLKERFVLDDFVLLWRAQANHEQGAYEKALADIREIETRFGESQVLTEALRLRIFIAGKQSGVAFDRVNELYKQYLARAPEDREVRFAYALFLRDRGHPDEADRLFRDLYIEAAEFSDDAAAYLDMARLDADVSVARGDNLMRQWKFVEAEQAFTRALERLPGHRGEEIEEKIALCVFRQKKYSVSARLYADLNDRYLEAVSYLRAGEQERFLTALAGLREMKDPRAGALLIAQAAERRRAGRYGEAVAILKDAGAPFREEILWNTGWTRFKAGEFGQAETIFTGMHTTYGSSRYLYWALRSAEKKGGGREGYRRLCAEKDYYGFIGCIRAGERIRRVSVSEEDAELDYPFLKRFNLLRELGFRKEALRELNTVLNTLKKAEDIILYSRKLREIGEYKNAISAATRVPYREEIHGLLYPFAYWDIVREMASRFEVHPLYVLSIAREESRLDPEAMSIAGAMGLMQLMPQTATHLSRKMNGSPSGDEDFLEVKTNIILGTYYLRTLLDRYGSIVVATAAYNAGENAVQRWLNANRYREADEFVEDIPFQETRNYVKKVMATFSQYVRAYAEDDFGEHFFRDLQTFTGASLPDSADEGP